MNNNIYYGSVELIDTRTKETKTVSGVVFKSNTPLSAICSQATREIPRKDQNHYRIRRFLVEASKVTGQSNV